MVAVIVAEKSSAAKNMANALGGMQGVYHGVDYRIVHLSGHVYEYPKPHCMVSDKKAAEKLRSWNIGNLPWDYRNFSWKRIPISRNTSLIRSVAQHMRNADEIIIATDLDPSGEGDLIFWEIADEQKIRGKKFSRMEFIDEAPGSIQKAFVNRRPVRSMESEGAYRKAEARSRMDYLTMQHTRIATSFMPSGSVVRQGRLKSAMVKLVGDQIAAYNAYVKKPFFQNRFVDENGVMYTDPQEPKYATRAEVPQKYHSSAVVLDSVTKKNTRPPKLYDLAALSSKLASSVKASEVMKTYQAMYQDQVVSYPRTEDKTITHEQFKELLPKIDAIARVVGVDSSLLTHWAPRSTHVKDGGAHGANRPGINVPQSMDDLRLKYGPAAPKIYMILARNYLAMLAEDYVYEQHKGHVADYPTFIGSINVPLSQGWKAVFTDEDFDDENTADRGLGSRAEPMIHEGVNPRPPYPTMKWLMKQLERYNVGTGATRTSTYADVTNIKTRDPLLIEKKGRISITDVGEFSHRILPGTYIGDLKATEAFYDMMAEIEKGNKTMEDALALVTTWVEEDKRIMRENVENMKKEGFFKMNENIQTTGGKYPKKEKASGIFEGQEVSFNREWGGVRFTDEQVEKLLKGETITFPFTSKSGKEMIACGSLQEGEYKGHKFFGFQLDPIGYQVAGHVITPEEREILKKGGKVFCDDLVKRDGGNFAATLVLGENGRVEFLFG